MDNFDNGLIKNQFIDKLYYSIFMKIGQSKGDTNIVLALEELANLDAENRVSTEELPSLLTAFNEVNLWFLFNGDVLSNEEKIFLENLLDRVDKKIPYVYSSVINKIGENYENREISRSFRVLLYLSSRSDLIGIEPIDLVEAFRNFDYWFTLNSYLFNRDEIKSINELIEAIHRKIPRNGNGHLN